MGRGIPQGGGNVLQGGGSVYTTVLFRDVDPLAAMKRKVEEMHTGFLIQIMGKRSQQLGDGTWEIPGAEGVW